MDYKGIFGAEYNQEAWLGLLHRVFQGKTDFSMVPGRVHVSSQFSHLAVEGSALRLGQINLSKNKHISVYEVELSNDVDIVRNRRGIRDMLTSDWRKGRKDVGAFILSFRKNEKVFRFSFVTDTWTLLEHKGKRELKKITTDTRRFTYLLGEEQGYRTAAERFEELRNSKKTLLDVFDAFSVEALTKDFYKEIEAWFLRAKDKVEFPGHEYLKAPYKEHQAKMTLRLITRLIFIWFLKEKGLVPGKLFEKDKIYPLLNRKKPSPYYRAILQNLFFATLNTPIEKREWLKDHECRGMNPKRGDQEYFRYKDFFKEEERKTFFISEEELKSVKGEKEQDDDLNLCGKIPFVNGGLFENLDGVKADDDPKKNDSAKKNHNSVRDNEKRVDCFSDEPSNRFRLKVPDELFFGEKEEGEGKKKKEEKGIIDILKQYNFTIEENTPNDEDIALDPELLGCVFEGLLSHVESEDSKKSQKKQKGKDSEKKKSGSFYTPREVVDYMVSESLKAYLSTKVNNRECLESLFAPDSDEEAKYKDNSEFKDAVAKALDEIKILDPACGSGAFPMGILSKVIQILEKIGKIDPSNPRQIYKKKLQIIQDCIYGVDIQDIAVQISKLRFFISLLCDQVKDDKKDNYGIKPLPNLETKIVCADTLKKLPKSEYDALLEEDKEINELKDKLFEKRKEYFNEKRKAYKRRLRMTDKATREELEKIITEFVQNNAKGLISKKKSELAQCEKESEKVKDPRYEEIAAVPVQQELEQIVGPSAPKKLKQQQLKVDLNEPARKSLEKEILKLTGEISELEGKISELEKAISGEGGKGEGQDDAPPIIKAAKLVAGWDPYDPSTCADFFSPEWMFGLIANGEHKRKHSDGEDSEGVFDIIIGNPPYIQLQKDGSKLAKKYESYRYKTFAKKGDIYCLFYERGWQLLKSGGHLCFITSNKWMRGAGYGEKLRKFFATRTSPKLLIDFPGVKIFPNATVDPNILLFQKSTNEAEIICAVAKNKSHVKNLRAFVEQEQDKERKKGCKISGSDSWLILLPIEQTIKEKIEARGTPLKEWIKNGDIEINYGVKTGLNNVFIINTDTRKKIIEKCTPEEKERTEELIPRVLTGEDIRRYEHKWNNWWLIATFPAQHHDIDQFPAVKEYLLSFGLKRLEQTGKTYTVKGERIKSRKKTSNKWFEVQDNISYWEKFNETPKIVYREITQGSCFSMDYEKYLVSNTAYIITGKTTKILENLIRFLNSKVVEFAYGKFYATKLGKKGIRWLYQDVINIPIPTDVKDKDLTDEDVYETYGFKPNENEDDANAIKFIESACSTPPRNAS